MLVDSKVAMQMFGTPNALIAAVKLVALSGIYVDEGVQELDYFHILFDQHKVIWAEGTPSESLFTGPEALKSLPPAARAELERLFPQINAIEYRARAAALMPPGKAKRNLSHDT